MAEVRVVVGHGRGRPMARARCEHVASRRAARRCGPASRPPADALGAARPGSAPWLLGLLALAGLLQAAPAAAEPVVLSYRAGLFSSLVLRGLQLSYPDKPVLMASADAYGISGWSVGGDLSHLSGPDGKDATGLSLRLGQAWALDDMWTISLAARQDRYPDNAAMQVWCYNQLGVSVMQADQWSLSWNWRPRHAPGCTNDPATPNRALDLNARWPLWAQMGLDAGIGRMSGGKAGYSYGQLGLYGRQGPVSLYVGRTQAWDTRRAQLDSLGGSHWVASLVWQF